jgi:hypothetical protein
MTNTELILIIAEKVKISNLAKLMNSILKWAKNNGFREREYAKVGRSFSLLQIAARICISAKYPYRPSRTNSTC